MRTEAFLRTVQEKVGRIDRKAAAVFHGRLMPVEANQLAHQLPGPLRLSPAGRIRHRQGDPPLHRGEAWVSSGPRDSNGRYARESSC
jgi:hypothetical protein